MNSYSICIDNYANNYKFIRQNGIKCLVNFMTIIKS